MQNEKFKMKIENFPVCKKPFCGVRGYFSAQNTLKQKKINDKKGKESKKKIYEAFLIKNH